MSRAQVIVPIFLDQFYHSDLVNVAWSGLGVSTSGFLRDVFFLMRVVNLGFLEKMPSIIRSFNCWKVGAVEDDTPLKTDVYKFLIILDVLCFPCRFHSSTLRFQCKTRVFEHVHNHRHKTNWHPSWDSHNLKGWSLFDIYKVVIWLLLLCINN